MFLSNDAFFFFSFSRQGLIYIKKCAIKDGPCNLILDQGFNPRFLPTVPILMDKKKLAVIHIVKKELSLSDGEYRNILERITGVRSAKDLTDNQFHKLMRYFVRTRHYRVTNKGITLRQKYYLRQLKERLQWDDAHFQNYIHKYFHNRELETYTRHDASNLIVALNAILKGHGT